MSKLNDKFDKISGIYKFYNLKTSLIYIGSSNNICRRLKRHLYELNHNVHKNYKIQNDFNKYGIDSFDVEILETFENIEIKDLRILEQYYVDKYNSFKNGYNLTLVDTFCLSHDELSNFSKQANLKRLKKIKAFNKDTGEFVKEFDSISNAAKELNTSSSNISRACRGLINYIKGYVFCYSNEYDENKIYKYTKSKKHISEETLQKMRDANKRSQKIYKYDLKYNLITTYISRSECERQEGFRKEFLRRRLPYISDSYILSKTQIL